jgi:hypothetical protein
MGLLMDIQCEKRAAADGPGAAIFWLALGASIGVVAAKLLGGPASMSLLAAIGGGIGGTVGLYAVWGTSKLAWVLALPDHIVDALIELARP